MTGNTLVIQLNSLVGERLHHQLIDKLATGSDVIGVKILGKAFTRCQTPTGMKLSETLFDDRAEKDSLGLPTVKPTIIKNFDNHSPRVKRSTELRHLASLIGERADIEFLVHGSRMVEVFIKVKSLFLYFGTPNESVCYSAR